jgi:hypothetical protein
MGLAAVGHHQLLPGVTAGGLFAISELIGSHMGSHRAPLASIGSLAPEEAGDEQKVA